MELNGISFAFGSFRSELFSTEDTKIVNNFYPFLLLYVKSVAEDGRSSSVLSEVFLHESPVLLNWFLNCSTLVSSSSLNYVRPQITFQPWIFMATALKTSRSLCFVSFVWKAYAHKQGEKNRERCELMHSWINQRHYHQIWSYGFVVSPSGYLEAMELMCTVNWDKSCLS